jgi:hypothetical protein
MKKITDHDDMRNFLQSTFSDFQLEADPQVWENIQTELRTKKRKIVAWWQYGIAASIALTVGCSILWYAQEEKMNSYSPMASNQALMENEVPTAIAAVQKNTTSTLKQADKKQQNTVASIVPLSTPIIAVGEHNENAALQTKTVPIAQSQDASIEVEMTNPISAVTPPIKETNSAPATNNTIAVAETRSVTAMDSGESAENVLAAKESPKVVAIDSTAIAFSKEADSPSENVSLAEIDLGMPVEEDVVKQNNWVLAANLQSSSNNTENVVNYASVSPNGFENIDSHSITTAGEEERVINASFEERTFLPPVHASVTINYAFKPKWSIESGISYSVLASIRKSTENSIYEIEQRDQLYYIGIPIFINYHFFVRPKFSSFFSSGIFLEKGVSHVNKVVISEMNELNETNKNAIDGIKYTVFLGLGAEYRPVKMIGLYVQPGISSYASTAPQPFDIGGSNTTGVKPSLRFGLRFHLN